MTRQEFLQELDLALQGQMGQAAINENIRYYETYIVEEAGKGKTEQMVIDQLGNPRLIAKTLINTTNKYYRQSKDRYTESYGKDESDQGFDARSSKKERWNIRLGKRNTWYGKFFTIAAAILIIGGECSSIFAADSGACNINIIDRFLIFWEQTINGTCRRNIWKR